MAIPYTERQTNKKGRAVSLRELIRRCQGLAKG